MNTAVNNASQFQSQQITIQAPFGQQDLAQLLPQGAQLQFLDLTGATIQKGDEQPLDISFDTALRFAPGSHLAMDYHASKFVQGKERKPVDANFDTVVSVNLAPDGQQMNTVLELGGKGGSEYKPLALQFNAFFSSTEVYSSSEGLPQNVPAYVPRYPIRASRILALHPHPQMANYLAVDTEPAVPDVRVTTAFRDANNIQTGGYLIFHDSGTLTYMSAQEFENTYQLVDNGVQQTLNAPRAQLGQPQQTTLQPRYTPGYGPRSNFLSNTNLHSSLLPTGLPMELGGDSEVRAPVEHHAPESAHFPPHPLAKGGELTPKTSTATT